MPNWCDNRVSVEADTKAKMNEFRNFVKSKVDGEAFSFDSVVPMPKELKGTSSPANILTQEEYDNYVSAHEYTGNPITKAMQDKFIEQYGADNWYDWANANWGTKWEVSNVEVSGEDETATYDFQTAWCPPEGVYNALVKRFPDLYISWFYDEPNMQLAGYLPY